MPVFDTNALVALFDRSNLHHAQAQRAFGAADAVLLHPCVISEFTTVVRRNAKDSGADGNVVARKALASLLSQPRVRIVHDMAYGGVVQLYMAAPALSFTDAVVGEAGFHFDKLAPVTFDKNIAATRKISQGKRERRSRSSPASKK